MLRYPGLPWDLAVVRGAAGCQHPSGLCLLLAGRKIHGKRKAEASRLSAAAMFVPLAESLRSAKCYLSIFSNTP